MAYRSNRRKFLQTTTALGVGYWVAGGVLAQESPFPNEKIGIAASGFGLKGKEDFMDSAKFGNLVAICEPTSVCWRPPPNCTPRPSSTPTTARCSTRWTRASTRWSSARRTTATP